MRYLLTLLTVLVFATPCHAAKKWRTYEDCILRDKQANDGDSFHARYRSEAGNYRYYYLRLYFVDTPETDDRFPERVQEQADYWGVTPREAIQIGKKAAKFTSKFLANGFTLHTKHADARGGSSKKRRYSMLEVDRTFLSEALVEEGLARVFGQTTVLPNGKKSKTYIWHLKSLESKAKREKKGAWALTQKLSRIDEIRMQAQQAAPGSSEEVPAEPHVPTPESKRPDPVNTLPEIEEQTITLTRPVTVYSLKERGKQVGILKSGAEVKVLGSESASMVRIRFKAATGKAYEAQCWRVELGL